MVLSVLQVVWLVSAIGLIILVLFHSPKGDGLGALGGQAQMFTSTKSAETALNRATWLLTILFMGITVILSAGWLGSTVSELSPSVDSLPIEETAPAPAAETIPSELGSPEAPADAATE
ncbi:preprotein translocase subunit SecG [Leptothoe sp. LEGE 181152]|uniref:Protein-export membrane protein SecG n=1 Tax=Adonisia turfae CCMR0081 TaxID=2292702 RepID=A0A6M0RWG4_9CYAN|nr:protein translocase, SecG subunit [Leptolyngbya sp. PCC 7375]MDV3351783.1 preprotein translocase subunit SecG [Leptothoe sp. LEGE 181152]NEZ60577.1 preprotein translocase subunit SecG [Adonisia turfae CCMR0081]